MGIRSIVLAAALVAGCAFPPILAQDSPWTLRFHGAIIESSAGNGTRIDSGGVAGSVDIGGGLGIGAEYRVSPRLGLEFSALFAGLEIGSRISGRAATVESYELTMTPFTFAVPFHFDTGGRVDLYVAPSLSFVRYEDIEMTVDRDGVATRVGVDSDTALGGAFGIDVPFGKEKWAFSAGLRYLRTRAERTAIDPVIVTLGFAYRF